MTGITLVTSFFNIGREQFSAIPRTDDTYLNNFKFWARIRNKLIVYTDKRTGELVMNIRKSFGLEDKTIIREIGDITSIEPEIYHSMCEIKKTTWFEDFRFYKNATSNIPLYSYLMLLKAWFLKDAVEKKLVETNNIAWFDFGFNHGGKVFTHPEDFDFEWNYNFSNKINLFCLGGGVDKKPVFEIVRRQCDSIMGCLYILPVHYAEELWFLTKDAMNTLLTLGFYDDDQLLLLMAYRAKPAIFEIRDSFWFMPLKEFGGDHLRVKPAKKYALWKKILLRLLERYSNYKKVRTYCKRTRHNLLNT